MLNHRSTPMNTDQRRNWILVPALLCAFSPVLSAQATEIDPVPPQITSAKTVFLSNAGSETNSISERAYTILHDGLVQWNHYQPVTTPGAADIVLELHYTAPANGANVVNGGSVPPFDLPRFQLLIIDRATHTTLWSVTEFPFSKKGEKYNLERNNDNAVNLLLADIQALAVSRFPSTASTPASSTSTKTRLSNEGMQ
jgi:hypothetical protein